MPVDDAPTRGPARPGPYVVVGVLLALGIVLPLVVPLYAHAEPTLIGLPFFYWYQMLWVLIEAVLLFICYQIVMREDRRRRAALQPPRGPGEERRP
jgi:uncharacterized BrkB/YihY/UPF0761 family membrane protein